MHISFESREWDAFPSQSLNGCDATNLTLSNEKPENQVPRLPREVDRDDGGSKELRCEKRRHGVVDTHLRGKVFPGLQVYTERQALVN